MTPLKEIESWCYKQIELVNRLYDMKDLPEVQRCGLWNSKAIADAKRVHIFEGIELIAAALKLPLNIDLHSDDMYVKSVTHLGVKFFQLENLKRLTEE